MVMMEAGRPMAIMTMDRVRPAGVPIRTDGMRSQAGPVRLTRRGRVVVAVVSALLIFMASVVLATAAQATHSAGGTAVPGRYLARVVVKPGQSLWTVAEAYDPDADTRQVIADIEQMNSMTGDQLQPGETLWVPRG